MNDAPLMRGPPEGRRVYLTFDDGPDPVWTPRVLDVLAAADVGATFFVVGRLARQCAAVVRRIAEAGHEIENHSWSHRHPWTVTRTVARAEVRDGAAAVADLVGRQPGYFRPPHGRLRRCMIEEAAAGGQRVALWSLSAIDWGPLGRAANIRTRLHAARAGDIILMHDGGRGINRPAETVQALPGFLQSLRQHGLVPSRLSALGQSAAAAQVK